MKQTVTIYKGLPGSGKTTQALKVVAESGGKIKRINKDDLRAMVDAGAYSKEREKFILDLRDGFIVDALADGFDVIVDDTNLAPKHIERITNIVDGWNAGGDRGAQVVIDDSFLKVPVRECIARDAKRVIPVGKKVIQRMAREAGVDKVDPYFIPGLPSVVICDLDGTLALLGNRDPYDASTCENDQVNAPVAQFVKDVRGLTTMPVFYFSGREEKYREQTLRWLREHGLHVQRELVMRPTGNYEKDVIVKGRMFEEHIRGKYNVHVVLDDRDQVVEGWRALGLNCWQVAEGDF